MYLHDWADGGMFAMIMDFEDVYITQSEYEAITAPYPNVALWYEEKAKAAKALALDKYQGIEVLLASYSNANYSGDAFVLFRKDGKLYEVNGSHCSCYGLENQWDPEETSGEALQKRLTDGSLGSDSYSENIFADELRQVLLNISIHQNP